MKNAKTGLRLLSFSLFITIGWVIASFVMGIIATTQQKELSNDTTALVSSCISVACYVIELIALHIAGKDNKNFRFASFLKIASLVLAVACVAISAVMQNTGKADDKILDTVNDVVNIVIAVADVIALVAIIKGCKEIAPKVKGQANLVLICFVIVVAFTIALSFIPPEINPQTQGALVGLALFFGISVLIAALLYVINYVILIFRTTKNVGQPRK